jgi:hypothetical protein
MPTWDPAKRLRNLRVHGLDFRDAESIWDNPAVTREDIRQDYGELRLVTFGLLKSEVVVLVFSDRDGEPHIISLRRAEKHEARYYFEITATPGS